MRRAKRSTCLLLLALLPGLAAAQFPWGEASRAGLDQQAGRALFRKTWVGASASTGASDGLGPLYNARSCAACHREGGGGHPLPPEGGAPGASLVLMLGEGSRFGRQLQGFALAGLPAEARIELSYEEIPWPYLDGEAASLRRPRYDILTSDGAPLDAGLRLSPRLAPSLRGVARLEAVPAAAIAALADPHDRDGDGVSGKVPPGRFGLQGGEESLQGQVARALGLDLGLGNPLLPASHGDCTARQASCLAVAGPPELEVPALALDLLTAYLRSFPAPVPAAQPEGRGRALFGEAGCAACHSTELQAGGLRPWSDLLLHDMGEGLADFTPAGEPLPTLWRTAPLWGLARRAGALLHDGRARTVEEAILRHGGEAAAARREFASLPKVDRGALIAFLSGL